jgi:hypothetical protein
MHLFAPTQRIWTEENFDQMGWHDCRLHAVGFVDDFDPYTHELRLDIDYILKWCDGGPPEGVTGFWISPATLVFDASQVHVQIPGPGGDWIQSMDRSATGEEFGGTKWIVRLNTGGEISVSSPGFRQILRKPPTFVPAPWQFLETSERGPISFDIVPYSD